jgi:hypothetical protein
LDKTRAVARLSALAAQAQGGTHGMVIGTVLDALTGGLKEPQPPKPTTQPLPWQQLMTDPEKSGDEGGIPVKSSIDEITKGANTLFRKLLKKD